MAVYRYLATEINGKAHRGSMTAPNPEQLKNHLQTQGLFLVEFDEKIETSHGKKLKANELADFCRELGSLLSSGVSMVRSLNIIVGRDLSPRLKNAFADLTTQVKRGVSLSDAMILQGKTFPEMLINMLRAGEASGRLDNSLMKMADHYEKEHRLNGSIKSALTYPCLLLVLTIVVVIGIFTFVLPTFLELFEDQELPALTQVVMSISKLFTEHFVLVICVIIGVIAGVVGFLQLEPVRYALDKAKIHMPKIGKLLTIIYTARFARTLASLYASGMTIVNSLSIARNTLGNRYISQQFDTVIKNVRAGNSLSASLSEVDGFDSKLYQTIAVGEETGKLDTLLEATADSYDYESQTAIKKLVTLIEPIMICVMAVIVVLVIGAVMLPIYNMYGSIEASGTYFRDIISVIKTITLRL